MEFFWELVLAWLLAAMFGLLLGQAKNRRTQGLLLGALLSWIGIVILAALPSRTPDDAQDMRSEPEQP
ncbi:MAG: hypothetical protein WC005_06405 [Candidatus Nanopelagicales bacterium]